MDPAAFHEAVESAKQTELDRLGSNKLLIALTDASLEEETILRAAALSEYLARETFQSWAESEESETAREVFEDVATQEDEHYERVVERLGEPVEPDSVGPMHSYLRQREDMVERAAAGLVGRGLVSLKTHMQIISFYINEADEPGANLFRELRSETEASLQKGLDLLEECCEDDEDWERAQMVAEYVVQVAYDDYADSLSELGVDPKPIC
ncbi:rubrerythrin family protein [Haloarchaeobius sp. HME9146]|uniref:rubrerythrin family protein n=1 Tax=Haloarchaeobius sp. HME9146 TaxID=2978732 RepID=UPI0021C22ECB|nr:rubrerythrin family protein [Haloarchaeobius sp. HME9146]MCT9095911.1 rubrerythrin family protein [Haloarchaeobius sp. HME9146]